MFFKLFLELILILFSLAVLRERTRCIEIVKDFSELKELIQIKEKLRNTARTLRVFCKTG